MSNGSISHTQHMGLRWCLGFAAFAALTIQAEIFPSDLDTIETLVGDIEQNQRIQQGILDSIYDESVRIMYGVSDIYAIFEDVYCGDTSTPYLRVHDSETGTMLQNLSVNLSSYISKTDRYQRTVTNKLDDVIAAINNLTNLYPVSALVYTNAPFLTLPTLLDVYGIGKEPLKSYLAKVYHSLTGVYPTADQLNALLLLTNEYGVTQRFYQDRLSLLGYPSDDFMEAIYQDLYDAIVFDTFPSLGFLGELYYYEYGTRPLIDMFAQAMQQFTNDFFVGESISRDLGSDGRQHSSFSRAFLREVGDLSSSFSSSVNTNISTIATNPIVQIADNAYATPLSRITNEAIENRTDADILFAVDNFFTQFQSFLAPQASADELTLDFGTISFLGKSQAVSFTFHRFSDRYYAAIGYMYALLKGITLIIVGVGIYDYLTQTRLA